MADTTTLARPYARAAFEYARSADALQEWSELMGRLSAIVSDSQMADLLENPDLDYDAKCEAVLDVCGDDVSEDGRNFVRLLAENRRLLLVPEIAEVYEVLRAEAERTVEAQVISARKLTKEQENQIAQALAKRLDRNVTIQNTIDKDLLGGAIIRAGDLVIDGSARGKLRKLAVAIGH